MAMAKKKKTEKIEGDRIRFHNIENSENVAVGRHAKAVTQTITTNTTSTTDIHQAFEIIRQEIQKMPDDINRGIAQQAEQGLKEEAEKEEQADEGKVRKYLNFLLETAPDAWDVAIATILNPVYGFSVVMKKIAQKAKEEKAK